MAKTLAQRRTKRLNDLLRKVIRLRDNDTCQRCGKKVYGSNSQPSHVIPKSRCLYLKYDLLNVKLLCNPCHRWWHNHPLASAEWFAERFPARHRYVKEREHRVTRPRKAEWEQLEAQLKSKLKELEQ